MFDICERIDKQVHFRNRKERRKRLIVTEIRDFPDVPVFVKDIDKKIPQLRNINIDGPGVEILYVFEIQAERTDLFPGDIRDRFSTKFRRNPVKEDSEIRNISSDRAIRKFAERKDIGIFLDEIIIIHGISPPVSKMGGNV